MNKIKIECGFDITPRVLKIVNFYKEDLPRYSLESNINYIHTIYLNGNNLVVSYYFGYGYIYKIKIDHIEENV